MAVFFSGIEVLQVAVKIEENGLAFYEQMMLNAKRPELKTTFEYLAGQEKIHKQVFTKMMESAGKSYAAESYPGEQAAYLKSLADSILFKPGLAQKMADRDLDDQAALDMALGFEKDSVLFYTEMRGLARESDQRVVDWVIGQEKDHVKRVLDLKKLLLQGDLQEYGH